MAVSCFDFRMRATSFDLHSITNGPKFARFSRLFRSKSDNDVKKSPPSSPTPADSPKPSPGAPAGRRRFVRVIRDNISEGEEWDNPHVVRKYTKGFWEKKNEKMQSQGSDEGACSSLPYTVTGHTILKKRLATESPQASPSSRHASFKEEVSVIEFDKKERIAKRVCHFREEKLVDSDEYDSESNEEAEIRTRKNYKKAPTNIESGKVLKQNVCPIDSKAFKGESSNDYACANGSTSDDMSEDSDDTECDTSQCSDYTDMIEAEVTKSLSDCDTCDKMSCTITDRVIESHLELSSKQRGPLTRQMEMES